MPLVVNTHGWTKGLGADLVKGIHGTVHEAGLEVTIINFAASDTDNTRHARTSHVAINGIHEESGQPSVIHMQPFNMPHAAEQGSQTPTRSSSNIQNSQLTAADLRTLSLISYFHLTPTSFSADAKSPMWDFSKTLAQVAPYIVPWRSLLQVQIQASEYIPYEEILRSLDVSIVGLREHTHVGRSVEEHETNRTLPYSPILLHAPLDTDEDTSRLPADCVGLGIIRSIDTAQHAFHVLSPLPQSTLQRTNTFIKGDIEVPTVLMLDTYATSHENNGKTADGNKGICGTVWKDVPYLAPPGEVSVGVAAAKRRVRRNVMRRSQMGRT